MTNFKLRGPVGFRYNRQNVTNLMVDQKLIVELLMQVEPSNGGKKGIWEWPPLPGADGACPGFLQNAINDFQRHWKAKGTFRNIDGVVDPGGATLYQLITSAGIPVPKPKTTSAPAVSNPRVAGTWQVTNMWAASVGVEVTQIGGCDVEITQPDGKKFKISGLGVGMGLSKDPSAVGEAIEKLRKSPAVAMMPGRLLQDIEKLMLGIGFNMGDYLQKFGLSLDSATRGRLIANPINRFTGRSSEMSRYLITEGGKANFAVISGGLGYGYGAEAGVVYFGGPCWGPTIPWSSVLGCYGSYGQTLKVGAGVQCMMYSMTSVKDA